MSAALGCTTRAEQQYPEATFVRSVLGPVTRAAAALRQQNAAGRYAESRAVAEKALADKLETMPMRRLLYQLGELQGDADLPRGRSTGRPITRAASTSAGRAVRWRSSRDA